MDAAKSLTKKQPKDIVCVLLPAVCFITIISQMPQLVNLGVSSFISMMVWGALFAYLCVVQGSFLLSRTIRSVLIMAAFVLAFWLIACVVDKNYLNSSLSRPLALSMFIMLVGTMCGRSIDRETLDKIFDAYIFASIFVTLSVYIEYLANADITDVLYAYTSKNSVSQIVLTSTILIVVNKLTQRGFLRRLFYIALMVFNVYVLLALKSRATLIMIPVIALLLLTRLNINKRLKKTIVLLLIAVIALLVLRPQLQTILIDNILFAGRADLGTDALTSGRLSQWESFFSDLAEYPLFGYGGRHRESMILASYLQYGVIFGTLIILVAISPLLACRKVFNREDKLTVIFFLMALCYVINGVFEMLAPFGPGAKCFLLWFLMGVLSTFLDREKKAAQKE